MKDLTQQMIDDYKHYLKESHWPDFARFSREDDVDYGPVLNIIDEYDGDNLISRIYQRKDNLGTSHGRKLDGFRASHDCTLNLLLNKKDELIE